jgi:hypothetical protein
LTEHPDFPKDYESHPVFKYIVEQLSKFEDASNCTLGYYNTQKKVNERIDKLNVEINNLHLVVGRLEKTSRSDAIAVAVREKLTDIQEEVRSGISGNSLALCNTSSTYLNDLRGKEKEVLAKVEGTNFLLYKTEMERAEQMAEAIEKLDDHIRNVDSRVFPPMWKIWIYLILSLAIGIGFGKFIWT